MEQVTKRDGIGTDKNRKIGTGQGRIKNFSAKHTSLKSQYLQVFERNEQVAGSSPVSGSNTN